MLCALSWVGLVPRFPPHPDESKNAEGIELGTIRIISACPTLSTTLLAKQKDFYLMELHVSFAKLDRDAITNS